MAINFPNSPTVNDTFAVGGINFTFTGVKWESGAVVELSSDTTPTLGGNLDGGAKNINNVGVITATGFSGPLTGNVTGNATGLTGDPSIQVTNATVLGNLDVQGTTSTIDTAITQVDSLSVEGSVGIGTTNPAYQLSINGTGAVRNEIVCTDNNGAGAGVYFRTMNGGSMVSNSTIRTDNSGNLQFFSGTSTAPERLRILSDGTFAIGGLSATPGTVAAGSIINANANSGFFTNGYDGKFGTASNHPVYIQVNGSSKLTIATNGDLTSTGTVSDSKGDLRKIIFKQESSAYTLVAADAGKAIEIAAGGITVPNGVFGGGDAITIINDSGSSQSITMGTGLGNMFNTGDGTSGNLTLAGRGMATIYFVNSTTCYISGGGLS